MERPGGGTTMIVDPLLTTGKAATYRSTSSRTFEDWRLRGGGPVYRKVGRRLVRYHAADLGRFVEDIARINTGGGKPVPSAQRTAPLMTSNETMNGRLGSGPVDQSQKMTVAARAMADKKTVGHLS